MAKTTGASAAALKPISGGAASPSRSGRDLQTDKRDFLKKLKKAVIPGKAMKKQLDDGRSDNAALRVQTEMQQQELALQNEEKEEMQAHLQDVSGQYQATKQQLETKDSELQVAMSKVEAFQVELQLQQETASAVQEKDAAVISKLNDKLKKTAAGLAQEEARVMVVREENNRLTNQVAAMSEDKLEQEREMQGLVKENACLQMKRDDRMQQLVGARQQQEDTEQMYFEVASQLNHARRDNDELKKATGHEDVVENADRVRGLETQIADWKAEVTASAVKWDLEKQQLTQQIKSLMSANEKASAELTDVALIREQLLVHVGIDLTYESIESLLDTKDNEIQMLTEQLSTMDNFQEQAICEAIGAGVVEAEALRSQLKTLQTQYDFVASEKLEQDKTIEELRTDLERVAEEHSSSLLAKDHEYRRACEALAENEHLTKQLENAQTEKQQLSDDFSAIESKIEALVAVLQIENPESADVDTKVSHNSRVSELEKCLEYIQEQLACVAKANQRQGEAEILQERIHRYEVEYRLVSAKLEECEVALKDHAKKFAVRELNASFVIEKYAFSGDDAGSMISNGETAESCNGDPPDLERQLELTRAQLHAVEAEMAACKAENLRMVFEVAKTADGVSKLKQDHEALLETHQEKSLELEAMMVRFVSLESANQRLASDLTSKADDQRRHFEAFAMQREDFESIIADLNIKAERKNKRIKLSLEDVKTENDVLEERISELHAIADSKIEPDERQEKDREVEELRSSLVQAKVNFLEQKQQLSALEKKLVDVSNLGSSTCTVNSALDAERREFEAALIEMIEMEKKLQIAYEAKQGLESTLQERMEAKEELEDRLSVAEDKIAELEQQLEQKVALIATIEEQLRLVEEEREKLADEFSKTKSKLERSRGKLEEKAIEFEAFKTTTNMLKDERSRLFNEIALLKDKIAKSEVQKAAMADSQELANEELEDQLNELADKIAEIEAEKQDLHARLEDTVYQSEEDIHQLRERLYKLEDEKSGIDDENLNLARTIKDLEAKLDTLEVQKAKLEAANESSCHQLTSLEDRVEKAASEIATLSVEKKNLIDLQQSLEGKLSAFQDEKVKLEQTLEESILKLRDELEQVTARTGALQTQLAQSAAEKEELSTALSELQVRSMAEKSAYEVAAAKLESQISENKTLENKIGVLKNMAEKALQSLQADRDELSEAKSRADILVEERDTLSVLLREQESANEALATLCLDLQQQVGKLKIDFESLGCKHLEEAGAAKETIRSLTDAEAKLTKSLESLRRDLAEAESCIMVLVEERDEARRDLTAKDLKIEVMTTQQGELNLVAEKLENELNILRGKSATEAEAAEEAICDLKESKALAEKTIDNLKESLLQAEKSFQSIREQLTESELHVGALEKERDAIHTSLTEKESTHEMLSTVQEDLQKKVDALESELKELRETSSAELAAANETITCLQVTQAEEAEKLVILRQDLAEAEGCVLVLVEERDAAKKTLSKRELALEVLSSEHGELQLKSQSMTTTLDALRKKSAADARAAEIIVQTSKEEVKRATESLEVAQKELLKSELHAASLAAECEAVAKTLSDLDTKHMSLSSQKRELELHIENLEAKIKNLKMQHEAASESSEETIRVLKTSEDELKELLKLARKKLSDSESRSESLADECDSLNITLSKSKTVISSFKTKAEHLQEQIQLLESELQELRSQRESDTLTAEETIRSLKESESQTVETLEAIRQELSETKARAVSAEEEHNSMRLALEQKEALLVFLDDEKAALVGKIQEYEACMGELKSELEERALRLCDGAQQIERLESQLAQIETQLRKQLQTSETNSTKEIKILKEQVASLSEASSSAIDEINSLREQKVNEGESYAAGIAQKDEVISTLKSKLEEVMAAYKRLKGHLQELQDRLAQQVTTNDYLKTSYAEVSAQYSASMMELDALKLEFASSRKQSAAMAEELRRSDEKIAESEAQHKTQIENFKKRVLAFDDEVAQMQRQHDVVLHEEKEKLLTASAARDETAQLKVAELEKSIVALTETVEQKELEIQSMAEHMRYIEQKHAQAESDREETARKHEAEQMELETQLSSASETIEKLRSATNANVGLQRETVSQLEKQITQLQFEVKVEMEGANAARVALETYKKRAHIALKKASSENKLNLRKAAETTTKLEDEILSAKARISVLETELEETRRRMEEVESAGDALAQSTRKALEADKRSQEAVLRLEIDSLNAEVIRLKEALDCEKAPLESQIKQLTERNGALSHEISSLKEESRTRNDAVEQALQVKEEKINDLSKQLHAALAAAASLAMNEAGRRSYSPPLSPTEKDRRSTASSSRSFDSEGSNSFLHQTTLEEQHEHIAAAVGDSCPIPLASKITAANGAEQQSKALVDEVVRLKFLLNEVQAKSHVFQKKYEDASALLEEANRQKQRLERSTQDLNIEYLKNVVIKYIESQVPSEKEQLVPVIAALLSFSPQEHHQVMLAHRKANDEGAGLFSGVFSLFGGGAATTPAPKLVAALHNFKASPTTAKGNATGAALGSKDKNGVLSFGSDSSDDEEFAIPLNPFIA